LITELKNNKAPGEDKIMGEIIKYDGDKLWDLIYELITNIWKQEEMPKEWLIALIHPIHKKNDKTNCSNYRGISLLNMTYKVMANIIAKRLIPYTEELLHDYQYGFQKNRSTTDHIFALRNIMEKCYEYNINLHQLFIDYKQAYDSVNRSKLFVTMKEFGNINKNSNFDQNDPPRDKSKTLKSKVTHQANSQSTEVSDREMYSRHSFLTQPWKR
jgi:hypothetical protein